jgi:hypothetical protein
MRPSLTRRVGIILGMSTSCWAERLAGLNQTRELETAEIAYPAESGIS